MHVYSRESTEHKIVIILCSDKFYVLKSKFCVLVDLWNLKPVMICWIASEKLMIQNLEAKGYD